MIFDLIRDSADVLKIIPQQHSRYRILKLVDEAIRREIHFIARHREDYPQALFQCLWNMCWWYDCPEAVAHKSTFFDHHPSFQSGFKLHAYLEKWLKEKLELAPNLSFVRSVFPPSSGVGEAFCGTLARLINPWQPGASIQVAVGRSGEIVYTSHGNQIRAFDVATTQYITQVECDIGECPSFRHGASRTVIDCVDRYGRFLAAFDGRTGHVEDFFSPEERFFLAFSPDNRYVVVQRDGQTLVWDVLADALAIDLNSCARPRLNAQFLSATRGVCWSVPYLWRFDVSDQTLELLRDDLSPYGVTPVFASDTMLMIVDAHKFEVFHLATKQKKQYSVSSGTRRECPSLNACTLSHDGQYAAFGTIQGWMYLWHVTNGACISTIDTRRYIDWGAPKAINPFVDSISLFDDCRRAVTGGSDGTVRIWDFSLPCRTRSDYLDIFGVTPTSAAALAAHNSRLVAATHNGWTSYSLKTGLRHDFFLGLPTVIKKLKFFRNGLGIAWLEDGELRVLKCGVKEIEPILRVGDYPTDADISETGDRIAIGYSNGDVAVWSFSDRTWIRRPIHTRPVQTVRFVRQDSVVITAGAEGRVCEWNLGGTSHVCQLLDVSHRRENSGESSSGNPQISCCKVNVDGDLIALEIYGGQLEVWRVSSAPSQDTTLVWQHAPHDGGIADFRMIGSHFLAVSSEEETRLVNLAIGSVCRIFPGEMFPTQLDSVSTLAIGHLDVQFVDVANGVCVGRYPLDSSRVIGQVGIPLTGDFDDLAGYWTALRGLELVCCHLFNGTTTTRFDLSTTLNSPANSPTPFVNDSGRTSAIPIDVKMAPYQAIRRPNWRRAVREARFAQVAISGITVVTIATMWTSSKSAWATLVAFLVTSVLLWVYTVYFVVRNMFVLYDRNSCQRSMILSTVVFTPCWLFLVLIPVALTAGILQAGLVVLGMAEFPLPSLFGRSGILLQLLLARLWNPELISRSILHTFTDLLLVIGFIAPAKFSPVIEVSMILATTLLIDRMLNGLADATPTNRLPSVLMAWLSGLLPHLVNLVNRRRSS